MSVLETSQFLLLAATIMVALSLVAHVGALARRRGAAPRAQTAPERQRVAVGGPEEPVAMDADAGRGAFVAPSAPERGLVWYGVRCAQVALVLLTGALVARALATGHGPFANQHEFAVSFGWGMLAAAVFFEWRYRIRALSVAVLPVALAMLMYADTVDADVQPLVPALQNHLLLNVHVATAVAAYGAAAVAFGAAVLSLLRPRLRIHGLPSAEVLDEVGYRAVVISYPLMTIMIILGAIWADIAWGAYWSWDPKETAALVTWLIYGAYLHARVVRDWRGNRASWLLILGFAAVLFTFFGNLFFGGLHSYA